MVNSTKLSDKFEYSYKDRPINRKSLQQLTINNPMWEEKTQEIRQFCNHNNQLNKEQIDQLLSLIHIQMCIRDSLQGYRMWVHHVTKLIITYINVCSKFGMGMLLLAATVSVNCDQVKMWGTIDQVRTGTNIISSQQGGGTQKKLELENPKIVKK